MSSDIMKGGKFFRRSLGCQALPALAVPPPESLPTRSEQGLSLLLLMRSLQGAQPCRSHVSPPTLLARPARSWGSCHARLDHAAWTASGALCSCVTIAENSAVPKKMLIILIRF